MDATYDVIVAGGGSAGLAAALAASRRGAKTLLIERGGALGGMSAHALVHTFCGLFHPNTDRPPEWLNPGIPQEIGEHLLKHSLIQKPKKVGRVYVLKHEPRVFTAFAGALCAREANLTVMFNSSIIDVQAGWQVSVDSPQGRQDSTTKACVDATGSALLARLLGPEHWQLAAGTELYRPAFICEIQGFTGVFQDQTRVTLAATVVAAIRRGELPQAAIGATFRQTAEGSVFVSIDLAAGQQAWNPLDPSCVESVRAEGLQLATDLWKVLRREVDGFAPTQPPAMPQELGIRESARWTGDYLLTGEELIRNQRFPDEVALAGWPLEIREDARRPRFIYFEKPEPAGIPAGSLRTQRLPGMFFAGRCLSSDHSALASVRVMGTCLATGQAAGLMAVGEM